ncbi:helix-turn-helix domain-containing protein [Halomonas litopenaei]|uniref:helix-turn-helix domain-containing protein n=1 Tax=Halomonas litopenaei TaxID=2109328 RepID=UPI003FA08F2B
MDALGPRIKSLRLAAGLNKAALARQVGVSDVTISYWESGTIKQIGHERLVALSQALNCPLAHLLEGEPSRPSPLYLRSTLPLPWQEVAHKGIDLPLELIPEQRWDGDCHLVTPAPDEHFDFLGPLDLAAVAPTEIFRQPGLYLVAEEDTLYLRRVAQDSNGQLTFQRQGQSTTTPYHSGMRLKAKVVALWRSDSPA